MRKNMNTGLIIAPLAILFLQTIISATLFANFNTDGGVWPIVLAIFMSLDVLYAVLMLRLVKQGRVSQRGFFWSAIILSTALFLYNNFWFLFGDDGIVAVSHISIIDNILKSPLSAYLFYALCLLAPWWAGRVRK